ncbi:MAG: DUF5522 domain-containing protein [Gemmataceae bacterium]
MDAGHKKLQVGRDYYLENGMMVFTREYLEQRGYCCASGCRHCPYGYVPVKRTPPRIPPQSPSDKPEK